MMETGAGQTLTDWWDGFLAWLDGASETVRTVLAIVAGGVILYVVGRLIIRGVVKGIARGVDWRNSPRARLRNETGTINEPRSGADERLLTERRQTRAKTIGTVLRSALATVVVSVTVLMALGEWGVDIAPIIASAGIVGVALGFGAQSLVKDLLSGVFMLAEDQYGVGDIVDLGQASGVVEEVGLRVTRLRSLDGTVWYVPNGEVVRVGNKTQLWSRALIEVRFDYDVDIEVARQAMLDAVDAARKADPEIDQAIIGAPEVPGVEQIDFGAVTLRLLVQVVPNTQWGIQRAVRSEMRSIFSARGIDLAAPEGSIVQNRKRRAPGTAKVPRTIKTPAAPQAPVARRRGKASA